MEKTKMLNQIRTLLNIEVRLEEMKLENGTVVSAETFEKGSEIFIVTDDEKVAMPVGEYILEDGRLVIVEAEGMIADVREVSDEVPAKETEDLEEETVETEVPEEVATEVEAIIEAVVEVIAPVIEEVKSEIEELKKQYASLMDDKEEKADDKKKEDLSAARKPITRNSQPKTNKTKVEFGSGKFATTLDRVLNKLNK
jgi:Mg2+ and Co2+ transporter CorA